MNNLKPSGYILLDGEEVATTVQCVHCGVHWIPEPGSGKIRGRCTKCHGYTCGSPACDYCVPLEVKLTAVDGGNVSESGTQKELSPYKDNIIILANRFGHII